MSSDLNFLFEDPAVSFRALKRKGALRYIASNHRGSLKAVTQFAPPTKPLPKLVFRRASLIDFRIPGLAEPLQLSKFFLEQVASCLAIPVERVGIYVGEPNERRKLVVIDVAGESSWVLKMAVGGQADDAIQNEREALKKAVSGELLAVSCQFGAEGQKLSAPAVREVDPIFGHEAILIERGSGKQLSPEEFEAAFFTAGTGLWPPDIGSSDLSVGEWLKSNLSPNSHNPESCHSRNVGGGPFADESQHIVQALQVEPPLRGGFSSARQNRSYGSGLEPLLAACRECGALELHSPLGVVHGDFAPWNIIQRTEVRGQRTEDRGQRSEVRNNDHIPRPTSNIPQSSALCAIDWEFSRDNTPLIFDTAYACWCYSELLGRRVTGIDGAEWNQLVALGALWKELRKELVSGS